MALGISNLEASTQGSGLSGARKGMASERDESADANTSNLTSAVQTLSKYLPQAFNELASRISKVNAPTIFLTK